MIPEQRRGQAALGQAGEPSSMQGREAAAAGGQAGPSPPRGARRLFPLKWGRRRGFGSSALLLCGSLTTRGLASLPPAHGSPAPPAPLEPQPSRQAPAISRPPSPTSLSPGDASFPLPTSPFSSWQILPLLLDPAALIIASFSWRQIVQPGAAPEGFRPLTNSLLIFCQKGMERGEREKGGLQRGLHRGERINQTSIFIIAAKGPFALAGCPWGKVG